MKNLALLNFKKHPVELFGGLFLDFAWSLQLPTERSKIQIWIHKSKTIHAMEINRYFLFRLISIKAHLKCAFFMSIGFVNLRYLIDLDQYKTNNL